MLYTETIEPATLELLRRITNSEFSKQFVLVGGTALALQIGHRKSIDLDFFSTEPFDSRMLLSTLEKEFKTYPTAIDNNTLIAEINDIKVDFITFHYPFKNPYITENGFRILNIKDIAPMKIDAITGRGHKKDFYDLWFLLNRFSLENILDMYNQMFGHQVIFHVIKSMTYFRDAETNPDPIVFDKEITWERIKTDITKNVSEYLER